MTAVNDEFTSNVGEFRLQRDEIRNDEQSSDRKLVLTISEQPAVDDVNSEKELLTKHLDHLSGRLKQVVFQYLTNTTSIVALNLKNLCPAVISY